MKKLFINTGFLDERASREFGLSSEILMENAAAAMANFVRAKFKKGARILGVIGGGNNGADVLAALRMLAGDYDTVALMAASNLKPLCQKQLVIALKASVRTVWLSGEQVIFAKFKSGEELKLDEICTKFKQEIVSGSSVVEIKFNDLAQEFKASENLEFWLANLGVKCVIDGLFGSGLSRDLSSDHVRVIAKLNTMRAYKLACDVPSGLDERGNVRGTCFAADRTITMGARKLGLYSDAAKDFVGRVKLARLGLSSRNFDGSDNYLNLANLGSQTQAVKPILSTETRGQNLNQIQTDQICYDFLLTKRDLNLPFRTKQNANKGSFGHVFIVAGQMSGAAIMAARAASAIGAGLISVITQRELNLDAHIMQAQCITDKMNAGAVGMGLGELDEQAKERLFAALADKSGLVLDADLCYEPRTIKLLKTHANAIVTPHPKEFASLLNLAGLGDFDIERVQQNRFDLARKFSKQIAGVLVLKGANTLIAHASRLYVMPLGSVALAKGGSGDVLAGLIAGLLAQGYGALDAAITGTLAHALSARKFRGANYALDAKQIIKGVKWLRKK